MEGLQGLFQLGPRGHLGPAKALGRQPALGKEALRKAHAPHLERLGHAGLATRAQDHLRRSPANVHHQPGVGRGLQVGHTGVDEAGLFPSRDDLDRVMQHVLGAAQEGVAVAGLAQRLRGHGTNLGRLETGQARRERGQAVQSALHRGFRQVAIRIQTGAQPHRFLEVGDAAITPLLQLPDLQAEAVGAQVDGGQRRGQQSGVEHSPDCAQGLQGFPGRYGAARHGCGS